LQRRIGQYRHAFQPGVEHVIEYPFVQDLLGGKVVQQILFRQADVFGNRGNRRPFVSAFCKYTFCLGNDIRFQIVAIDFATAGNVGQAQIVFLRSRHGFSLEGKVLMMWLLL